MKTFAAPLLAAAVALACAASASASASESEDAVRRAVAEARPSCRAAQEVQWMCTGFRAPGDAETSRRCGFLVAADCDGRAERVHGHATFDRDGRPVGVEIDGDRPPE